MRAKRMILGSAALAVLCVVSFAAPAQAAVYDQVLTNGGLERGTAQYSTSTKQFKVKDTRYDGYGVEVQWSYKGEIGVHKCKNNTGVGTTKTCTVSSGKTILWRMWLFKDGLYYPPPTAVYTHGT